MTQHEIPNDEGNPVDEISRAEAHADRSLIAFGHSIVIGYFFIRHESTR